MAGEYAYIDIACLVMTRTPYKEIIKKKLPNNMQVYSFLNYSNNSKT